MGTSLVFTSAPFGQSTPFSASITSESVITTVDATYDRRIYGLVVTNSAAQTPTCTFRVKDASANTVAGFIVTLTTGVNVMTDVFNNAASLGLFQKQKDASGTPYFNLPHNWYITAQFSANTTAYIYTYAFGETYA